MGDAQGDKLTGERIIRADAEAVTIYLPGGQEVTIPRDETRNVSAHRYYTFNGETIAVRDERGLGGVTSLVNDHHGTPIVSIPNTTWTQASVAKHYSDPFGAARGARRVATDQDRDANGSPGDRGFLGKSNDTTGLTQVGARYYDSTTGSFVSPDPVLDPSEARHLNAYAYSYQNPTTHSDPTGLKTDIAGGGGCGSCIPEHVAGKDRAMASRAAAGVQRASAPPDPVLPGSPAAGPNTAAAMAWLEDNIYPFRSPGAFGIASWMTWNQIWSEGRAKGLEVALKNYQGRKGNVRTNALTELENAGHGKGTKRLNAAKADKARSAKIGRSMKFGGGALSFGAGAYSQYGESSATESSNAKIAGEMAVTGLASTTGAVVGGALGLLCGPGAPACSTGLAIAGGAVGGYLGTQFGMWANRQW